MGLPAVCCRSEKLNAFKGSEREKTKIFIKLYITFISFTNLVILHLHLFDMDYVMPLLYYMIIMDCFQRFLKIATKVIK